MQMQKGTWSGVKVFFLFFFFKNMQNHTHIQKNTCIQINCVVKGNICCAVMIGTRQKCISCSFSALSGICKVRFLVHLIKGSLRKYVYYLYCCTSRMKQRWWDLLQSDSTCFFFLYQFQILCSFFIKRVKQIIITPLDPASGSTEKNGTQPLPFLAVSKDCSECRFHTWSIC